VIVKATKDSEAGVLPSAQLLADMGKYNEQLMKAGVMLAGEGLHYACLHELFVVLAHVGEQLGAWKHAGFRILCCLDDHHESHRELLRWVSLARLGPGASIRRGRARRIRATWINRGSILAA